MGVWYKYSDKNIEDLSTDELIAIRQQIVADADNLEVYDGHPENWDAEGELAKLLWDLDDELASRNNECPA